MLTVEQAAARLGVGEEQVRRLARAGTLPSTKIGTTVLVDDDAVERRARARVRAGRTFAPRIAWAALWLLSGRDVAWLTPSERSRLRSRLRGWTPEEVVAAQRFRARRHDVRVLPQYRDRVLAADGVVASGMTAAARAGADIVAPHAPDEVYCSTTTLARLRATLGLTDRGEPNLVVRLPAWEAVPLDETSWMPSAVVAVDLAESDDVRTRRAGMDLLAAALADLSRR